MVVSNCSGLEQFFESDDHVHHAIWRWWAELFQFHFVVAHQPAWMLFECDLLSRYNQATEQWRYQDVEEWKHQQVEEAMEPFDSDVKVDHLFISWVDLNISSEPRGVKKCVRPVELEVELSLKQLEIASKFNQQ